MKLNSVFRHFRKFYCINRYLNLKKEMANVLKS